MDSRTAEIARGKPTTDKVLTGQSELNILLLKLANHHSTQSWTESFGEGTNFITVLHSKHLRTDHQSQHRVLPQIKPQAIPE